MQDCYIRLAGFRVLIHARYAYVGNMCFDYRIPPFLSESADLVIDTTEEEIDEEEAKSTMTCSRGYLESLLVYRKICRRIPVLGGMLFHSAVITDGTHGYAFTADSGTGKTTHVRLWQKAFGEEITIVNGDKPIVRLIDGHFYAYGTPWCGKEGLNRNMRVPLTAICFLRRGQENRIRPFAPSEAVTACFPQMLLPDDPAALTATLDLLDRLVSDVPLFELSCTISEEAARVARSAMQPSGNQSKTDTENRP